MRFDGPGGILARASDSFVYLDSAELWCVSNTPSKVNAFSIYTVVLHELGQSRSVLHSSTHCINVLRVSEQCQIQLPSRSVSHQNQHTNNVQATSLLAYVTVYSPFYSYNGKKHNSKSNKGLQINDTHNCTKCVY